MELTYNGVKLELMHLDRVTREAVYDPSGTDLLYVRWIIGATGVLAPGPGYPVGTAALSVSPDTEDYLLFSNPGVLSTQPFKGGNPNIPPWQGRSNDNFQQNGDNVGYSAAISDVELRTRLWVQRAKLLITAQDSQGNTIRWLESPPPGFPVDACLGPKPISVDVVNATGNGDSMGVYFQIETCTTPCPDGSDRLVLSHRWQMAHNHDEDYYLTRMVEGEVIFNGAMVHLLNAHPDQFRSQFFHPIPVGMHRRLGPVVLSPDGLTLRYSFSDTDPTIIFDPGDSGASQMSIVEQLSYMQPSPWRLAEGALAGLGVL